MNQGIHGVNLLQYIMGPVRSEYAQARTLARNIEVEDSLSAVIEFSNGSLGVIQAVTSVHPRFPRRLEINGNKGLIALEDYDIKSCPIQGSFQLDCESASKSLFLTSSNPAAFGSDGHVWQFKYFITALETG